ncbi:ATP-grasp domain-containing protein [Dactylosporangium sp. McL0621]|uniref:ATP-grasp domain-containing protein n=1 Tax=Dactylosporangium sp. McL0621 TaxID=3415678 RepID=UPI003CEE3D50
MSTANLIILGAGEDQVPAYVEGRRLGYRIIGVDQKPDALGASLADEFLCLTTREPEAIARRLGAIDVAAVISPASDAAQASVAALSRHYGTAFQPAPDAVRASEDKGYFLSVVEKLGLPRYRSVHDSDPDALARAAAGLRYPLVVKPADASGSKGLRCVTDPADLPGAISTARKHSFSGEIVVEEFVSGTHYSVECFARDGRPELTIVTERTLTPMPHMISVSHLVPASLSCAVRARLQDMVTAVLAELGHRNGPVNLDVIAGEDEKLYFVELGARLGGNGMPRLAAHAYGVNTVAAAIRLAAGRPPELTTHAEPRVVMLRILTADTEGVVTGIAGADAVRALPDVAALELFKEPGQRVHPYTQAAHKLGYLIVAADTRESLQRTLDTALTTLCIDIEPDQTPQEITS